MLILIFTLVAHLQTTGNENSSLELNPTNLSNQRQLNAKHLYNLPQSTLKTGAKTAINKDSGVYQAHENETIIGPEKVEQTSHISARNLQLFESFDPEWDVTSYTRNRTIPAMTMDLYKSMANYDSERLVPNVDVIRLLRTVKYLRTSSGIAVKFNFTTLTDQETRIKAQLYINLHRNYQDLETHLTNAHIMRLHHITDKQARRENVDMHNPDLHELLGIIYLSRHQGWQIFHVEKSLEKWLNGKPNLGFLITITDTWGNKIDPKLYGWDTTQSSNLPVLVVHLQQSSTNDVKNNQNLLTPVAESEQSCGRRFFHVDFKNEGLDNFIIHPEGITLYKCGGICQNPYVKFTNHAKLVGIFKKSVQMNVCCVPGEYSAVTIAFFDRYGNVVIKKYQDMIVNSCSCR